MASDGVCQGAVEEGLSLNETSCLRFRRLRHEKNSDLSHRMQPLNLLYVHDVKRVYQREKTEKTADLSDICLARSNKKRSMIARS